MRGDDHAAGQFAMRVVHVILQMGAIFNFARL
jgi:hypothetical protein